MKCEKYLTILLVICMLSYYMMIDLTMAAETRDMSQSYVEPENLFIRESLVSNLKHTLANEKKLAEYTQQITGFSYDDSLFIIKECKEKELDPFIVLGVIKRESDFNPYAKGKAGERGLGQLMENTARPVAENLGYVYDPDKLFDVRYNLKLTIAQISYLYSLYNKDIHKALTAYNRGQQGLVNYMERNTSNNSNPAESDYSHKVLIFATEYKELFNET
ncbi:transglycosylase SLT domain-containing protein [Sedimentibacter hydroxybenzoicus DSM 7310]|uniref:Transglycosylase SLT domain-containing protein n=1 Tax=Sedimentibacter hydroxybenzoicus DSM 7310 TaxID=1123245 RepID=A0A974BN12_SEDHY|nr:transglycosylase SLT domain-containing protein [Sedimentibacter hydroxybenzoicus]NYB75911.1 transglycosylase SLT domain-containing protein [Sedimentibacter hydroxybenzoicus DSM 7310]